MKLTKEQVLKNLEEIVRFGGLAMSSEFVESVRIAMEAYENQQDWIPVSERLPKENERCLCSYKDEEGECIDFGLFKDGAWYVKGVMAWMPLPEPYKESEDKECIGK